MKECLNCKKEYEPKRDTSKFCSVSCRVLYNRGKPKQQKVNPIDQMIVIRDEMVDTMFKIRALVENAPVGSFNGPRLSEPFNGDDPLHPGNKKPALGYNELRELIEAATSSTELHKAWKEVEKNKELAGWQTRELGKLKEHQRTKIDF